MFILGNTYDFDNISGYGHGALSIWPVTRELEIKCLVNRHSKFQQLGFKWLLTAYASKLLHLLYIFSFPQLEKHPVPFQN